MKCSGTKCPNKAQFAKAGTEEAFCEGHSPVAIPALHDLDELPVNGWDHVDVLAKCRSCERWEAEASVDVCDRCSEHACEDCIGDGACKGCLDAAEYRADVDYSWRHR